MPRKRPESDISSSSSRSTRSVRSKTSSTYSHMLHQFSLDISSDSASHNWSSADSLISKFSISSSQTSSISEELNVEPTATTESHRHPIQGIGQFTNIFNPYWYPTGASTANDENLTSTVQPTKQITMSVPEITDNIIFRTACNMQRDLSPENFFQESCDICSIQIMKKNTSKIGIQSASLELYYYKFNLKQSKVEALRPKSWSISLEKYLYVHQIRLEKNLIEYLCVCSTCRSCLVPRLIPQFSILNNVFPESLPDCMIDKNELSLAESIAVAKVCRSKYNTNIDEKGVSSICSVQSKGCQNSK